MPKGKTGKAIFSGPHNFRKSLSGNIYSDICREFFRKARFDHQFLLASILCTSRIESWTMIHGQYHFTCYRVIKNLTWFENNLLGQLEQWTATLFTQPSRSKLKLTCSRVRACVACSSVAHPWPMFKFMSIYFGRHIHSYERSKLFIIIISYADVLPSAWASKSK